MILPSPPLRRLARLKLRGIFRKQWRRARTPSGAIFAVLGMLAIAGWLTSIFAGSCIRGRVESSPDALVDLARTAGLVLTVLTIVGATGHRGLYLPKEEIEPLFAAPVTRADLVRYRLLARFGQGIMGGIIFGVITSQRAPVAIFGFLGAFVAMQTLNVFGQTAAILFGLFEKKTLERVAKRPLQIAGFLSIIAMAALGYYAVVGGLLHDRGGPMNPAAAPEGLTLVARHPIVVALSAPFTPWVNLMVATSFTQFLSWLPICLAIFLLLVEVTARLPVDYRELSLETAANVAERIRRARRAGGGVAAAKAAPGSAGRRIPWLFGRGPLGAVAWTKTASIVRRARGTIMMSIIVMFVISMITRGFGQARGGDPILGRAITFAAMGTLYLSFGLRFDFREELDRMDRIKTWPLPSATIFLGMLLPEWLLISSVMLVGLIGLQAVAGSFTLWSVAVTLTAPFLAFAWIATDNIVFLFSPVRLAPGSDSGLNLAGRSLALMFLRFILFGVLAAVVGGSGGVAYAIARAGVGDGSRMPEIIAIAVGLGAFLGINATLTWLGGRALARFDVARKP